MNGIKGTKINCPKRNVHWRDDDGGVLYDQYGFNSTEFNKDGYNIYGFDKNGLNINGCDMYGNKKKSSKIKTSKAKSFKDQKGKGHVNLPIALPKIYTNNSSKELINGIKQLINDLYDTKQITKQVYNNLIRAITYLQSTNVCLRHL